MSDRICKDGTAAATPELEKWYSNAIAEVYAPDGMKVTSVGPTRERVSALANEVTHARSGALIDAGTKSIVVAESGSIVGAHDGAAVVAKNGSIAFVSCPARAVAEAGSQVIASNGAIVDSKPGSLVLDRLKTEDTTTRYVARVGVETNIPPTLTGGYWNDHVIVPAGANVTTRHHNTIAEAGASVTAEEGATVLAQPGSRVHAMRGSVVFSTEGAQIERERGAEVVPVRGFLGQEHDKEIHAIGGGGQLSYFLKNADKVEVGAGQHVITGAPDVVAHAGAYVEAFRPRQQSMQTVRVESGASVEASGNTNVIAEAGSQVLLRGGARAEAQSGSNVIVDYGATLTNAQAGSRVTVRDGGSVLHADKGAVVTYKHWKERILDALNWH